MSREIGIEGVVLMKEWLDMAVRYIIDTRRGMNRPPYMATASNIKNVLSKSLGAALEQMVKDGVLTERRTLNESAYELTDNNLNKGQI